MSQASATRLLPKLRFKLHDRRNLKNPEGPKGRHDKIKKTVTALFKHERIELNYDRADESRGYAERLLSDAIRYGDTHKPTMEMASYWIIEKQIIHKLFKVLAPRYKNYTISYTKLWRAPKTYPGCPLPKCVLELRNNIYPKLGPDTSYNKNLIHNILLEEAKKEYRQNKALKAQEQTDGKHNVGEMSSEIHPDMKKNVQVNAAGDGESAKTSNADDENESPSEQNLQADSGVEGEGETKENSEVSFSASEDLDLSKMKIKEEKQVDDPSEEEKK